MQGITKDKIDSRLLVGGESAVIDESGQKAHPSEYGNGNEPMKRACSINGQDVDLGKFAVGQWSKTLQFLRKNFPLSEDDCKDVFQESFLILHRNISEGKTDNLKSSLSTYFIGICRNKAMEMVRDNSKNAESSSIDNVFTENGVQPDKAKKLLDIYDNVAEVEAEKEKIVQRIVNALPSPCNELLWGFYRDNFNMKTLADMFGYSSENSVKVTKHRCCEKFRRRYREISQRLF